MLWYVPNTRILPLGLTTRQTSRNQSQLNLKNSSWVKLSHCSAIVTCDENAQPRPLLPLRPLPEPMLKGGSTMQWSMDPAGHRRVSAMASPCMMRFGSGAPAPSGAGLPAAPRVSAVLLVRLGATFAAD